MTKPALRPLFAAILGALALNAGAVLDVDSLDRGADPCADFYRYANGRWIESTPIPDDRSRYGAFDQIDERNEKILRTALEEARRNPPPAASAQGKVARYFASGMDRDAIEKTGLAPLDGAFARAAAVKDAASLAATLAAFETQGFDAGFNFAVRPDAKESTRYLAQLGQGGLGLPDRDYYFRDDAQSVKIREAYLGHVARMLALAGAGATEADSAAKDVLALETELARASMTNVERRDVDKTYNKMTVAQLAEAAPGFPWQDYFAAMGAKDVPQLNVAQREFFKAFAKLAASEPAEHWREYLRWQVLRSAASKLPAAFAQENFDFYEGIVRGKKVRPPREREVIEVIGGRYGGEPMAQAMAMIFVRRSRRRACRRWWPTSRRRWPTGCARSSG